ncbi:MAG: hypothetical protein ACFCUR_10585 [Rhodomicrobiaceae bacterium]
MPASTTHITSLTADYDAIERAIRETSRGRWFLSCYLERNRSAETKMLLSAISKLETAMRDNGQIVEDSGAFETLLTLRQAFDEARDDMAQLPRAVQETAELPLQRFDFRATPSGIAEEVQAIRDAAASIHSAAYALQAAGVFQGVARQIAERADAIEHACAKQDAAVARAKRMAALLSEIEAELISSFDDSSFAYEFYNAQDDVRRLPYRMADERTIPNLVVEEISAALAEQTDPADEDDGYGPAR